MRIAVSIFAGLFAAPAAAQLAVPEGGLELVITEEAQISVAPQGYQFFGYLPGRVGGEVLHGQLSALELPVRPVCLNTLPTGFIGNALLEENPEPAANAAAPEHNAAPSGEAGEGYGVLQTVYQGQFASLDDFARARDLFSANGGTVFQTGGVLFDCDDAMRRASLAAVEAAQLRADRMASSLGLTISETRKIEFNLSSPGIEGWTIYGPVPGDEGEEAGVTVAASVTVTYRAELGDPVL